ncbi:MAG TPA: 4-(cytidine 5'-diphospho)-2-C-methyl-D-erythritol kinase [Bacillota bacterium]|nr:4-(cytidine 5'-diphospho)-2-C-methyl-D-erythritol kinase [Bacillota bacterium]
MLLVTAPAKLNLTLEVGETRDDGYHGLDSVFSSLCLADRLLIRDWGPPGTVVLSVRGIPVPEGAENICLTAARRLAAGRRALPGVELVLSKVLPVGSGLGGGSADAAAALAGLNRWWGLGRSRSELGDIALSLGSDVPFCLLGGQARVRGRGEIVEPLPFPRRRLWLVLLRPPGPKSTRRVYEEFDRLPHDRRRSGRPDTGGAIRALAAGDWETLAQSLGNSLEPAVAASHPDVERARVLLATSGALGTAMTGSGPTVFGIARDQDHARAMAREVSNRLMSPDWWMAVTRLAPRQEEDVSAAMTDGHPRRPFGGDDGG